MKSLFLPSLFCGALAFSWMISQAVCGAQNPDQAPNAGIVLGKNFTHSAGIEMVWVPDGKFWIGRGEVTQKQFHTVMADGLVGEDKPVEGVSISQAKEFCRKLNEPEKAPEGKVTDAALGKAPAAIFMLPTIAQWQQAKVKSASLGLTGTEDALFEWTSNVHGDGLSRSFPQAPVIKKRIGKDYPVVMTLNGPLTLESVTTSAVTIRATTKTAVLWSGRLGFRVILIPKP